MSETAFNNLVSFLEQHGYSVKIQEGTKKYRFAILNGFGITGGFTETISPKKTPLMPYYLTNRIAIDNEQCFDKWSKCPIALPLPNTKAEFDYLLSRLQFWGTEGGYARSNNYDFEQEMEYPKFTSTK
jgi:hypothetical protein